MTDLAKLEAFVAITELKARYCRTLDTKDWAGFADCFTEDYELDTRPAGGYVVRGRDEAIKLVRGSIETATTAHQVHAPEIQLDGDTANVIWAMQDRVIFSADKRPAPDVHGLTGYGHYHERYVRKDGRWRIAALCLTRLCVDIQRGAMA